MVEQILPLTASEEHFWRTVAFHWVRQPGLVLAVVPTDINSIAIGRWVRDYVCAAGPGDPIAEADLSPDRRHTYVYDLSDDHGPRSLPPNELLSQVWAETQREEDAERAAQGEQPFYLMLTGVLSEDLGSLARWGREVAGTWPARHLMATPSRFHCCCVLSTPLPVEHASLMDGITLCVYDDPAPGDVRAILQAEVQLHWASEERRVQEYLWMSLVDMSSGRRPHAEAALTLMKDTWPSSKAQRAGWTAQWTNESYQIFQARAHLARLGLTDEWLRIRLSANTPDERTRTVLTRRLWAHGLWVSRGTTDDIWSGLTTLARAALHLHLQDWDTPVLLSEVTLEILRRCLCIEHDIKSMLLHLLRTPAGRARVRAILDRPNAAGSTESRRDYISRTSSVNNVTVPVLALDDAHVISCCTFGAIRELLLDLLTLEQRRALSRPLNELVQIRNRSAHLGTFTIDEYEHVCGHIVRVTAILSRLFLL